MKMSTNSNELYELLDSSSEDMLLYFQELAWHLEGDVDALSSELSLLFANEAVELDVKDEHQEGQEVSKEILAKVNQFKELAKKNSEYKKFAVKYGEKAAKTLLGLLTMRFTSNPAGYGADDYAAIVGHLFTSDSELQAILSPKYPKVVQVVRYVISKTATKTESEDFRKAFAKACEEVAEFHKISFTAQARYLNFVTAKDRENISAVGILGVMDVQLRSCFNPFFQEKSQLPDIEQKINSKQSSADDASNQMSLINKDIENGLKLLLDIKEKELSEMKDYFLSNETSLVVAILKGDDNFKIVFDGKEQEQSVASIIGFNTAGKTARERLEIADKNIAAINKEALETAILDGREVVEVIVDYKKQQQKVSSIIGVDTANMREAGKKEAVEKLEALKAETHRMNAVQDEQEREQSAKRISDFLLSIKRKEVAETTVNYKSTKEEIIRYNEDALMIAILEGKKSFEIVISGKWLKKTVQVADVIGVNPAEMTPSQRLETVNNVEGLKANHCSNLWCTAKEDMEARREAFLHSLEGDIDSKTAQTDAAFAKGIAILDGTEMYTYLNPEVEEGISTLYTAPGIDIDQCSPARRLDMFNQHCKESNISFSGGPFQKLREFAKTIKNFVHKTLDKVIIRETVVQESSSAAMPEKGTHKDETKLSKVATMLFLANHPIIMPSPGAIKIPGVDIPTNA
jgi:hypothetical protein